MLFGLALTMMLTGCASNAPGAVEPGYWFDGNGNRVDESAVVARFHDADIVLFGEVHDSEPVHRKQLELLGELAGPVVLALEQLDLGGQDAYAINSKVAELGARERAKRGGFDFDGWGWSNYRGLFEMATSRQWPLWPLNLPRDKAIAVAMARDDGWAEHLQNAEIEAIERFGSIPALPESAQARLVRDLQQAHCGRIDAAAARGMSRAQIARDMLMADALARAASRYPAHLVVGVMGNQHARRDRGVGYWLDRPEMHSTADVVAIGMLPVDSFETLSEAAASYDFVWITEPVERNIDCDTNS